MWYTMAALPVNLQVANLLTTHQHFVAKFSDRVEEFGRRRMDQELQVLRLGNQNLQKRCVQGEVDSHHLPDSQKLWGKNLVSLANL